MQGFHFWQFVAGIAVFVYAMNLIEVSVKGLAGRSFKKFLQKQSKSQIKMLAASTAVTALLQSSSIVLLMILSFVGAGLLHLKGALAAVLGSNLGTTITSWIIAIVGFRISFSDLSFPILGVALIGLLFSKKDTKLFHCTNFLIGFALIFISLEWLKACIDKSFEQNLTAIRDLHYIIYIFVGLLFTAVIQSSSVTIAITLTSLHNNLIPFESAAAIVIGSELGTALKFIPGSIGGISDKKRVAWGNLFLNFMTMVMAASLIKPLIYIIQEYLKITDPLIGLVSFQSGINLLSIILFLPFLGLIAKLLERFFKDDSAEQMTRFIRKKIKTQPEEAFELVDKEIIHLINDAIELHKQILELEETESSWIKHIKDFASDNSAVTLKYEKLKLLQGEILEYITEIPKSELSKSEFERITSMVNIVRHVLRSVKNVKDIIHNLEDFEASANDKLFETLHTIRSKQKEFYQIFQELLDKPDPVTQELINTLLDNNRKHYDESIAAMLHSLEKNHINELDSTNLLNVHREIYSSNKALIRALADLFKMSYEEGV